MLFRFRKFPVYLKAKELRKYVKNVLQTLPSSEFNIKDQIDRAALPICLNIAEGSNRRSDKDKAHFLNQSLTSLEEVVAGCDILLDDRYVTSSEMNKVLEYAEDIGKQLIGFAKSLQKSS